MLEIIADNVILDLDIDIQITLIIENPFMINERIPTPYSLSFDLPPTQLNLKTTKWPNRVTAFKNNVELNCSLKFDSITFARGLLSVDDFDEKITVSFKSVSAFDNLRQKLQDIAMKKVEFGIARPKTPTSTDPGRWVINRDDPGNFAGIYRAKNNAVLTAPGEYMLAPVKIANTEWKTMDLVMVFPGGKVTIRFNQADNTADQMYLNFFNISSGKYDLFDHNTRAFPFPYLKYLFDQVFSDALAENPFSEGELSKLLLICPYHPKYYTISGYIQDEDLDGMLFDNPPTLPASFTPFYQLNSFLPDIYANDFLKDILKIFCMSLLPAGDKFRIVKNKDIMNDSSVENWDHLLINRLKLSKRSIVTYKYGYANIKDEYIEVPEENKLYSIKDLYDKVLLEVNGFVGDFFIKSTGEYYTKSMNEDGSANYKLRACGYGNPTEANDDVYDTISNVNPLPMTIDDYWTEQVNLKSDNKKPPLNKWYVPEFSGDRMSRGSSAFIMIDRGLRAGLLGNDLYPLLTATENDHYGSQLGELSLAWEGENGLIKQYHQEFKDWIEKEKVAASGEFIFSAVDLKMLDFTKKKHILGRNFYFEKIQVVIEFDRIQPAQVDLIEA
jgi:hypothetical protein